MIQTYQKVKKSISESLVWKLGYELVSAVAYLHSKSIVHRDIKTQNVFLTKDNTIKLGDLGEAKVMLNPEFLEGTKTGTPLYLAPEMVKRQFYGPKVDVWAVGCILYQLTTLHPPFQGENLIQLGIDIVKTDPKPIPKSYSMRLSSLVMKLLTKSAQARPSMTEVLALFPYSVVAKYIPVPEVSVEKNQVSGNGEIVQNRRNGTPMMRRKDRNVSNLPQIIGLETSSVRSQTTSNYVPQTTILMIPPRKPFRHLTQASIIPQDKKTRIDDKEQSIFKEETTVCSSNSPFKDPPKTLNMSYTPSVPHRKRLTIKDLRGLA